MPILFVSSVEPIRNVTSANGDVFEASLVETLIKTGCQRCKTEIKIEDISKTILRAKDDGSYRILCNSCIQESTNNAKANLKLVAAPNVH